MLNWTDHLRERTNNLANIRPRLIRITGNSRYLITQHHQLLNFVSNDYLGLSMAPELIDALATNSRKYGVGSTGAPSLSGYSMEHNTLQDEMAQWLGYEKCLLFNSGYQLDIGIFSQLIDQNTTIWFDKRCHASHIDGILLSRAKFVTFDDTNIDDIIQRITQQPLKRHIILSEGSFSMDGTCSYWHKLVQLKQAYANNILLIIDDAHGIGALGNAGYGSLEQLQISSNMVDVCIGTFGKAFGSHGGFICGSAALIDYLQHSVRSQIFSTNLPPSIAATSIAGLRLIKSQAGYNLRQQLAHNIQYFQQVADTSKVKLYNRHSNNSAIQLIICNSSTILEKIYKFLFAANIIVGKIMYPTVPKETPRLRIALNAMHTSEDINILINYLVEAQNKYSE